MQRVVRMAEYYKHLDNHSADSDRATDSVDFSTRPSREPVKIPAGIAKFVDGEVVSMNVGQGGSHGRYDTWEVKTSEDQKTRTYTCVEASTYKRPETWSTTVDLASGAIIADRHVNESPGYG